MIFIFQKDIQKLISSKVFNNNGILCVNMAIEIQVFVVNSFPGVDYNHELRVGGNPVFAL